MYSPSPSPLPSSQFHVNARSPSPYFSDSSHGAASILDSSLDADQIAPNEAKSVSRPGSPVNGEVAEPDNVETVLCRWEECGQPYSHLPTLIEHIHNDHIGVNKSTYTCEWSTCPRRGMQQASRFALISHIRAHTGEKPFTCPLPECDKSFTRSDAMAKHMRLQHNISPPLPGRGGNRKRKRGDPEGQNNANGPGPGDASTSAVNNTDAGFNTFKIDASHTPPDGHPQGWDGHDDGTPNALDSGAADYFSSRRRSISPGALSVSSTADDGPIREDQLPPALVPFLDHSTGLVYGRSVAQARYLCMKAKHRFALEQHENLLEELRVMRDEERRAMVSKEEALDAVMRAALGPQAEFLIAPASLPRLHHATGGHPAAQNDFHGSEPMEDLKYLRNGGHIQVRH